MSYPIVLNGDHAEYERDNEGVPPKERSDWPLPSFDGAKIWAEAFWSAIPRAKPRRLRYRARR